MSKRAKTAHRKYFGNLYSGPMIEEWAWFTKGYEQAEKDIITLIESSLSELFGDAQPTPILRYKL